MDDAAVYLAVLNVEDRVGQAQAVGELFHKFGGLFVDEDVAVFVPFAVADEDSLLFVVHVREAHVLEFGAPAAGGVHEADDEVVTFADVAVLFFGGVEEQADFFAGGDGGESAGAFAHFFSFEFVV